jgi:hypothetical protein
MKYKYPNMLSGGIGNCTETLFENVPLRITFSAVSDFVSICVKVSIISSFSKVVHGPCK